jgi:hypothetical protein
MVRKGERRPTLLFRVTYVYDVNFCPPTDICYTVVTWHTAHDSRGNFRRTPEQQRAPDRAAAGVLYHNVDCSTRVAEQSSRLLATAQRASRLQSTQSTSKDAHACSMVLCGVPAFAALRICHACAY